VRVLGGEDIEVGLFDGPDAAVARARDTRSPRGRR
jgi:hypothetical protein